MHPYLQLMGHLESQAAINYHFPEFARLVNPTTTASYIQRDKIVYMFGVLNVLVLVRKGYQAYIFNPCNVYGTRFKSCSVC